MKEIWGKAVYEAVEEIVEPSHTAVLVVDIQNDHGPSGFLARSGNDVSWVTAILPDVRKVLDAARRLGMLVIFTRNTHSRDGRAESPVAIRGWHRYDHTGGGFEYELEGTWGNEVLEDLAPRPDEVQIVKYRSSAFHGTHLDLLLRNNKIESVVVMGLVTHGCVEATVRDAASYDYYPVVLRDCVASGRRDLHDAALLYMQHRYDVISSGELLEAWRKGGTPP